MFVTLNVGINYNSYYVTKSHFFKYGWWWCDDDDDDDDDDDEVDGSKQ